MSGFYYSVLGFAWLVGYGLSLLARERDHTGATRISPIFKTLMNVITVFVALVSLFAVPSNTVYGRLILSGVMFGGLADLVLANVFQLKRPLIAGGNYLCYRAYLLYCCPCSIAKSDWRIRDSIPHHCYRWQHPDGCGCLVGLNLPS